MKTLFLAAGVAALAIAAPASAQKAGHGGGGGNDKGGGPPAAAPGGGGGHGHGGTSGCGRGQDVAARQRLEPIREHHAPPACVSWLRGRNGIAVARWCRGCAITVARGGMRGA